MARFNSVQNFTNGRNQVNVNRNENLIAHSLFVVLVVGAIIGGLALLVWSYQAGAATGGRTSGPPTTLPVVAATIPVKPAGRGGARRPAVPTSTIIIEPIKVEVEIKPPPPSGHGLPPNLW